MGRMIVKIAAVRTAKQGLSVGTAQEDIGTTKTKKKNLPSLKNLSFKDNGFLNQSKLNQIFSPIEVSDTGKNGDNTTLHLF